MSVHLLAPEQLVVSRFIADLRTHLGVNIKVGDHEVPENAGALYAIVYSIPGGAFDSPSLADGYTDPGFPIQVSCVGRRRDQVQLLADQVNDRVIGRNTDGAFQYEFTAPAGWALTDRRPAEGAAGAGVVVEGVAPNRVLTVPKRYTLHLTPAA